MGMGEDVNTYHPWDPGENLDPFPVLAELRKTCPVYKPRRGELPPVTLFTRYDDTEAILRDYRTFANIGAAMSTKEAEAVPIEKRMPVELNPPEHTDVRRLL